MPTLQELGWDDTRAEEFAPHAAAGLVAGRVAVQHRGAHDVLTEDAELRCDVAGRLYDEAGSPADLPAVGDWVAVAPRADEHAGTVQAILPRRTKFSRKTAWQAAEEQVVAANVDVVFIVTSIVGDLSLRRLERYLILARESGARPIILLAKSDLAPDVPAAVAEIGSVAFDLPVHAISSVTGEGLDVVRAALPATETGALLGSSGVGKSTLINALIGEERFATQELREDGRGRHTTTRRELVQLPWGAWVIDTPGMRELQLWVADEGLEQAFGDVTELFEHCRFTDCRHESEPGCAVKAALADGTLAPERWESYLQLEAELEHLERRLDKRAASEARRQWRSLARTARQTRRMRGKP